MAFAIQVNKGINTKEVRDDSQFNGFRIPTSIQCNGAPADWQNALHVFAEFLLQLTEPPKEGNVPTKEQKQSRSRSEFQPFQTLERPVSLGRKFTGHRSPQGAGLMPKIELRSLTKMIRRTCQGKQRCAVRLKSLITLGAAFSALWLGTGLATAGDFFSLVEAHNSFQDPSPFQGTSSVGNSPVQILSEPPNVSGYVLYASEAVAGPGVLKGVSTVSENWSGFGVPGAISGTSNFARSSSEFAIYDLNFTPITLGGQPPSTIPVTLNLNFHGILAATIGSSGSLTAELSSKVSISGSLVDLNDFSFFQQFGGELGIDGSNQSVTSSGVLQGLSAGAIGTVLNIPLGSMPINTPLFLLLSLDTSVHATALDLSPNVGGATQSQVEGVSDFGNTFGFPTSGPVFQLPKGFTANSPQGNIVNNQFGPAAIAVPEPASMTLVILGGLGIIGSGWLRRGRAIASSQAWSMPSFATP